MLCRLHPLPSSHFINREVSCEPRALQLKWHFLLLSQQRQAAVRCLTHRVAPGAAGAGGSAVVRLVLGSLAGPQFHYEVSPKSSIRSSRRGVGGREGKGTGESNACVLACVHAVCLTSHFLGEMRVVVFTSCLWHGALVPVLQIDAVNSSELTVKGRRFSRCDPLVGEYGVGEGGWMTARDQVDTRVCLWSHSQTRRLVKNKPKKKLPLWRRCRLARLAAPADAVCVSHKQWRWLPSVASYIVVRFY